MFEKIVTMSKRFQVSGIVHPFRDYTNAIVGYGSKRSLSFPDYKVFEIIYNAMLTFKKDYFCLPEYFYFLTQLYFGIRACELKDTKIEIVEKSMVVRVKTSKGSTDRLLKYPLSTSIFRDYACLYFDDVPRLDYKNYYRSLKKGNPNFFKLFGTGHLTVSHIARHFHVQVLRYVLCWTKKQVSTHMGWGKYDTIENYIDKNVWNKVKEVHCHVGNNRLST